MSLIEKLQNPMLYDHPIEQFEVIETHISWVLLTGDYVYKIKKPVNFGFLDFSTLEKRRFYCHEEVRLNRRLAPQLYLGVIAIHGSEAHPELDGQGPVIEYAVKMRQFPQSMQLDRMLAQQGLDNLLMDKLASKVAQFHLSIEPVDKHTDFGDIQHIQVPMLENFEQIRPVIHDKKIIAELDKLESWTFRQLEVLAITIQQRKAEGFVRACHGDMHLKNIALWNNEIIIFDCIEFNENLYWIDVISEIAFLLMDLEDRQQYALAQRFLNHYLEITGDYQGLKLFRFYKVYRAMVRTKVNALRLQQEQAGTQAYQQTFDGLLAYLVLAKTYIQPTSPCLLINHGLSGAGKSVGTCLLLEKYPAIQVRSDVERKRLYQVLPDTEITEAARQLIYSAEATRRTYARLVDIARCLLDAGYPVVIDAANLKLQQRQLFYELARSMQVPYFILAYQAPVEALRQRIKQRTELGADVSDATLETLEHQLTSYEPLSEKEKRFSIEIASDGHMDIDAIIEQLSAAA
ncbi:MAG: AAA family ATPase [Thioalkalispiraceae bacterium]|jgi:aminoglycoside phosphotransferase family enzyme/predicted kinase